MVPSFNWKEKREKMLQDYTSTENGILVLTSDKTFSSPSTAADFCIGSSNNGWLIWKEQKMETLIQFIENSWINNNWKQIWKKKNCLKISRNVNTQLKINLCQKQS